MPQADSVARPERVPLVTTPGNRDASPLKDSRMVNCYAEKGEGNDYQMVKRPGLLEDATLSKTGDGRGLFFWDGAVYAVFGTTLYKDGTSVGTVDGTNGIYAFSINNQASPAKLQLNNGVKAYNYDTGGGLVEITDPDFVNPHVKGWGYLDGTTYYMDAAGAIRGSAIGNPTSWDALNKIIAQIEADKGVVLSKQLVYIVALKQWTVEAFYDAGNTTGSPLGAVQGAKVNFGCAKAESLQDIDGTLFWLGNSRASALQIVAMDSMKPAIISTRPIDRLLEGASLTGLCSWTLKIEGHSFYGLTIPARNLTLVFDLTEKLWAQWTDPAGNYFPIVASSYNASGQRLLQHATNGKVYKISQDYLTDAGSLIPVDLYTPNFDRGTRRRKVLGMMEFTADQIEGCEMKVRWSDDDYKSWTNFRTVDLAIRQPRLEQCGTFERRAFHFRHCAPTRLRVKAVDLQLDTGTL